MSEYLEPGDLVIFYRKGYRHWTVYSYEDRVISFTDDGWIREVDFEVSQENSQVAWQSDPSPFSGVEVVHRARSQLGHRKFGRFNALANNCEHFSKWCRYNEEKSTQSQTAWSIFGTAILTAVGGAVTGGMIVGAAAAAAIASVATATITSAAAVATATLSSSTYKLRNTGRPKENLRRLKYRYKRYGN
ncbi:uncharacterized protein LOC121381559 [Gigantopelta aegis]|uniref:uncharacterized protein LOC121381559 n=1 Tax=Gigantopelta aegis TaxID=1735272 RepID=UPI001B888467|nr:uncharacterized protein LOC121381559 [Gigantopelta aegis]